MRFTLPVLIAATICFSNNPRLSAQNEQPSTPASQSSPPSVLEGSGKKISLNVPMFGAAGNVVCDSSGNLFFHVSHSGIPFNGFLGISADGSKHTLYSLPSEIGSLGNAWTVSPDGILYVLHGDFKNYQLIRFKRDGSVGRTIPVDIPAGVLVQYLAVADSGTMYIQGYRDSVHGKEKPEFASLFDDSGKLIRDLKKEAQKVDTGSFATGLQEGDAVAGTNGRFYGPNPS
jgi:hypothetical protein